MLHRSLTRIALVAVVSISALPRVAQAGALTDLLIAKVGVTQPQADGGAGSIFKLARAQMTPENFQKLSAVVPGMGGYLGAAPAFLPGEQPAAMPGGAPTSRLGQTAALAGMAGGGTTAGTLAAAAGGGSSVGVLAAASGGRSTTGALAAAATGGSPVGGLAAAAGGGSASGALAAAALGQPVSPTEALKGAARNKLAASVGGAMPGAQTGLAGVTAGAMPGSQGGLAGAAAGALAGNAGGMSAGGAAGALLAGTALGDKLQAVQALAPAFQALGMNQSTIAQFLPIVVGYVKEVGGKSSSKLLTHALGL